MSWFKNIQLPNNFFWGVGVVALVSLLVLMSKKLYESSRTDPKTLKNATALVFSAAKSLNSSQQSSNPIIAFTDATEASTLMNVALTMAKESELEKTTKMKIQDLASDIEQQERTTREKLTQVCPQSGKVAAAQTSFVSPLIPSQRNPNLMPVPSGQAPPAMFTYLQ